MIEFGEDTYTSRRLLSAGDVIKFSYDTKARVAVIITPNWNEKCDCYEFNRLEDISEDMLFMITMTYNVNDGELFHQYGNEFDFKSFRLFKMRSIRKIEVKFEMDEPEPETDSVIENIFELTTGKGLYGEE